MKILIEFESILEWRQTGLNVWQGFSGNRIVGTISKHYITGGWCTTWFEDASDEMDTSVTGDLEFLKRYTQERWDAYLHHLSEDGAL